MMSLLEWIHIIQTVSNRVCIQTQYVCHIQLLKCDYIATCHEIMTFLSSPQPSPSELTMALCSALADILWKVGGCAEAVVAL